MPPLVQFAENQASSAAGDALKGAIELGVPKDFVSNLLEAGGLLSTARHEKVPKFD
jgi:hypothetical protein